MRQILRASVVVLVFLSLHGSVRSSQGALDNPPRPGIRKETGDVRQDGESRAEGDPVTDHELERQRRAAEDLWIELTGGEGKVENHEHWERIVRRSARGWYDPFYLDDTVHIVDVQDYYRHVLDNNWEEADIQGNRVQAQELNAKAYSRIEISKPIPGRYIVMLQTYSDDYILDRTIAILQQAHAESEGRIRAEHITPLRSIGSGFTATMNSKAVELLRKNPFLDVLEEDIALKRATIQESDNQEAEDQHHHSSRIPWNLDRLDQHGPKLDNHFNPEGDGQLASIYIIDTGINYDHEQFEGRAHYSGFDAVDKLTGSNHKGRDCEGHGTHCAGTAAGKTYGVARKATIYSVRALGCNGAGAVSGIVEGMDYIAKKKTTHSGPVIFSMSLGVRASHSLNAAVKRAMAQGIAAVGAAGNQGDDSCKYSPASARDGIAVGATDQSDKMVAFSNAGACTDVYAPGTEIKSATSSCNTCTKTFSGTSMAAPHVAGYIAIILSLNPKMTAVQAKQMMIKQSTKDAVNLAVISSSLASRTPNRLLYIPQIATKSSKMKENAHIQSFLTYFDRP